MKPDIHLDLFLNASLNMIKIVSENSHGRKNLPSIGKTGAGLAIFLALLVSPFLTSSSILSPAAAASSAGNYVILPQTGVYIPLYMYATSSYWTTVINAKLAHPSVPIIACINPSSGVGSSIDNNFVNGINKLKAAGVIVLGYVSTSYATRSISSVETEMQTYKNWYNVDGIKFDQMSNSATTVSYYTTLDGYAVALGMKFVVGNPGASVPSSFVGSVDNISIYESSGTPSLNSLQTNTFYPTYDKRNFSFVSYGVSNLDTTFVTAASQYVGLMYITNDVLPNPYDTLPPYFGQLVATLDTGSPSPPPVDTTPPSIAITTPINGATMTSSSFTANGTASDNVGVAKVEVALDGGQYNLASGTANWSYNLNLSAGTHSLTARASDAAGNTASQTVTFTISTPLQTISPKISLSPGIGSTGSIVKVTGTGFAAGSTISAISYDGAAEVTNHTIINTDSAGVFAATFNVPGSVFGQHAVTAVDATGHSAKATFNVVPEITLNPSSGPVKTTIKVTGTGFAPNSQITATYNGISKASITTNSTGWFYTQFSVRHNTPPGSYTVTATDAAGHNSQATFTVY